ncbi:hypothetical protein [Paraburkholderia megapolitana]|uniref:Uncharacterized protein n=1 Tax=Paraburkholderia megapolitana TaxID=420953 RepID=A0A1I3TET4_9BURK|nr:hypothetical protein [Paraburkholderia megapolitana]QDQ81522.1 hypothetical protein FNZ07_10335 [Paraburkholderia megapolitana]SFJ68171.1 hypothetical protein SAMN05192543_109199 [Paraburkholderia megapolitana]
MGIASIAGSLGHSASGGLKALGEHKDGFEALNSVKDLTSSGGGESSKATSDESPSGGALQQLLQGIEKALGD